MAESMDTSEVTLPDEDDRKLFVGGLPQVMEKMMLLTVSWPIDKWDLKCKTFQFRSSLKNKLVLLSYHCVQDAKQDDISAHFQSFGELDNINLKTDPATGRSR